MLVAKRKDELVEIEDLDDLLRIAREVRADGEPLVIATSVGEEVVFAAGPRSGKRDNLSRDEQSRADSAAFLSSAGSLAGLFDPEEFKRRYRAARGSNRPPIVVELPEP